MIYGVTIMINDVNFKAKNYKDKVKSRLNYEAFFTSRKAATSYYLYHKKEFENQKGITYRNTEQRGRCEVYKCNIQNGQVMNYGVTIHKENI